MRRNKYILLFAVVGLLSLTLACKKEFLEAKPSTQIVMPKTLDELQKLLDNPEVLNVSTGLGVLSADEYRYTTDATWTAARSVTARNAYIWAKDLYEGQDSPHWNQPYSAIFYANNILVNVAEIPVTPLNQQQWNDIKGAALFTRAFAYYELVNNFANFYEPATATTDLGVPLRLKPSIDVMEQRASVAKTYDQIFTDLVQARQLLVDQPPMGRTRPSVAAVHALLSRIYLNQRRYPEAERHADSCLQLYSKLIDYNGLSKTSQYPFDYNHDEVIYSKRAVNDASYSTSTNNTVIQVSDELIGLYGVNDLRLAIFFKKQADGTYDMKGGYSGPGLYPFIGLATDEVLLNKAECLARKGEATAAMLVLDQLLIKRWNAALSTPAQPYQPATAQNTIAAIDRVLLERRKELVWRNNRWDDIKRLNKEGRNIALTRTLQGKVYSLAPNSRAYVFPIPENEISLSGIEQNIR